MTKITEPINPKLGLLMLCSWTILTIFPISVACFVAYLASGHRSIYSTQRIGISKVPGLDAQSGESLEAMVARRPRWLTHRPVAKDED